MLPACASQPIGSASISCCVPRPATPECHSRTRERPSPRRWLQQRGSSTASRAPLRTLSRTERCIAGCGKGASTCCPMKLLPTVFRGEVDRRRTREHEHPASISLRKQARPQFPIEACAKRNGREGSWGSTRRTCGVERGGAAIREEAQLAGFCRELA